MLHQLDFSNAQCTTNSRRFSSLTFFFLYQQIQEMERLQIHRTTRYLAKKYFDIYLNAVPNLNPQKFTLVLITCIRTAAKFNESQDFSDEYTVQFCYEQCSGEFQEQQFINCEIQLLQIINFKLAMNTPYDYLFVMEIFPKHQKILQALQHLIDLCISLAETRFANAQEIFFGCLYYCCETQDASALSFQIIRATTMKWNQSVDLSAIIAKKIEELEEDELTDCEQIEFQNSGVQEEPPIQIERRELNCGMEVERNQRQNCQMFSNNTYIMNSQMVPQ